jgi:hypothetical protein
MIDHAPMKAMGFSQFRREKKSRTENHLFCFYPMVEAWWHDIINTVHGFQIQLVDKMCVTIACF